MYRVPRSLSPILGILLCAVSFVAWAGPQPDHTTPRPVAVAPPGSRLDEVGDWPAATPRTEVVGWKRELRQPQLDPARAALLHLWLGEYLLAHDEQPTSAAWHFRTTANLAGPKSHLYGQALYDQAIVDFREGAYAESARAFNRLLVRKPSVKGIDRRHCALWARHAAACAGYHAERARMGITEPERRDPRCGAAGLAVCLRSLGRAYDLSTVLRSCRVTGIGSSMQDLQDACRKLHVSGRVVTADDAGLKALPKPLVAYVEHDHFIAVLEASARGVTYLCSDCGGWPGGRRELDWKQWHALEAGLYLTITRPNSPEDQALAQLDADAPKASAARPTAPGLRIASAAPVVRLGATRVSTLLGLLRHHAALYLPATGSVFCGSKLPSLHCAPNVACPMDCPSGAGGSGPSAGDPVNLATGEEEYRPAPDLVVYNPFGPSVVWGRMYNSLRGPNILRTMLPDQGLGYNDQDFGVGWSHNHNVYIQEPNGDSSLALLMLQNGATISFSPSGNPVNNIQKYSPNSLGVNVKLTRNTVGQYHYTLTMSDESQWEFGVSPFSFGTGMNATARGFMLATVKDRLNNRISMFYGGAPAGMGNTNKFPKLEKIRAWTDGDAMGHYAGYYDLLTIHRTADFIDYVTDVYGRQIVYDTDTTSFKSTGVAGTQVPYPELSSVNQISPTTDVAPHRYTYGYANYANGDGAETVPFLHEIRVPSPTGSADSSAFINYDSDKGYVHSLEDANHNTRTYEQLDDFSTRVTIAGPGSTFTYSYITGFNSSMSLVYRTEGCSATDPTPHRVLSLTYGGVDGVRPTAITDGTGYTPLAPAATPRTTYLTWDTLGHLLSVTTPRGVVTTYTRQQTYGTTGFGVLTQVQQSSATATKIPTNLVYDNGTPSRGLLTAVSTPQPGAVRTPTTAPQVTTNLSYDDLGNILNISLPQVGGAGSARASQTFDYLQDGLFFQFIPPIGRPLSVTDSRSHETHSEYNDNFNVSATEDPSGFRTNYLYNIANQVTDIYRPDAAHTAPPTTGHGHTHIDYLYPGGPVTKTTLYTLNQATPPVEVEFRSTTYQYGPEGELLSTTTSGVKPATITYDPAYRMVAMADGRQNATVYHYNLQGHVDKVTYPNLTEVNFNAYDGAGRLQQCTDAKGTVIQYQYEDHGTGDGRLADVIYPGMANPLNVHLEYDSFGRLSYRKDASGEVTFAYDDRDVLTDAVYTYKNPVTGAALPASAVSYRYRKDGTRSKLIVNAGTPIGMGLGYAWDTTYDAADRPTSLTNPVGEVTDFDYGQNNWLLHQAQSTGVYTDYTYTGWGQISSLISKTPGNQLLCKSVSAAYDPAGSLTGVTLGVPANSAFGGNFTYTYDGLDRVTSEGQVNGTPPSTVYTSTYGYDATDNATTFRSAPGPAYGPTNEAATNGYDNEGNPVTYGGLPLSFDLENRLTAYGTSFTAGYRADGLRAWKRSGTTTTYYLYDGMLPVAELDDTGHATALNTFGPNGLISRRDVAGNQTTYYLFDFRGNVQERLNASGTPIAEHSWDGYGASKTAGTAPTDPWGFGAQWGGYTDRETTTAVGTAQYAVVLMGRRYYDPAAGRFLTRDPAGYGGGANLYAFANGNPVNFVDPSGLGGFRFGALQLDDGRPWFDFNQESVTGGLFVGGSAVGSAFSFGLWDGGAARCDPTWGVSRTLAEIGAQSAMLAATAGSGAAGGVGAKAAQVEAATAQEGYELVLGIRDGARDYNGELLAKLLREYRSAKRLKIIADMNEMEEMVSGASKIHFNVQDLDLPRLLAGNGRTAAEWRYIEEAGLWGKTVLHNVAEHFPVPPGATIR